jgi:hypothetical protein
MPAKKIFHLRCPVIAVLQPDDFWRSAAGFGEVEKIGISRYDGEPLGHGILPNDLVRSEPGEPSLENVDGSWEKVRKTAYELGREICVKEKLQRDRRSRPVCEAYA